MVGVVSDGVERWRRARPQAELGRVGMVMRAGESPFVIILEWNKLINSVFFLNTNRFFKIVIIIPGQTCYLRLASSYAKL